MRRLWVAVVAALAAAACSADVQTPDATPGEHDGGVTRTGVEVAAPTPPAEPMLEPCPPGWSYSESDGCAPATATATCAADEAQFPSESGCARIGAACPAGDFPENLPGDAPVLYVLAGAANGTGTREQPLGSIAAALTRAQAGSIVALGKGTYDEAVALPRGVTLWGACVAATRITKSGPLVTNNAVIYATGAGSSIKNLRLGPSARPGIIVGGTFASLDVEGVLISEVDLAGIIVAGRARVTARDLAVRDSAARAIGVGWGLDVEAGYAEVTRAVFERAVSSAVFVRSQGTRVRLEDVAIRDTKSEPYTRERGVGLDVELGAAVELVRSVVERNRGVGILVIGEGTTTTIDQVIVRDTDSYEHSGESGKGLVVQEGAWAQATRSAFVRNRDMGAYALGAGSRVELSDVLIRDTDVRRSDGWGGAGLSAQEQGSAVLRRGTLEHNRSIAIYFAGEGVHAELEDVVVRDTQAISYRGGILGMGMAVVFGAQATASRILLERNRHVGVLVDRSQSELTLEDVVVRDTGGQLSDGTLGRGLNVQLGGTARVTRALFERNRDVSVFVAGATTTATLLDIEVRQTLPRDCSADRCQDNPSGNGILATGGAATTVRRFRISESPLCGVMVARAADLLLEEGEVTKNAVGACVLSSEFDIDRLSNGVDYSENGKNLDTASVPVPDLADEVGLP